MTLGQGRLKLATVRVQGLRAGRRAPLGLTVVLGTWWHQVALWAQVLRQPLPSSASQVERVPEQAEHVAAAPTLARSLRVQQG